MTDTLPCISCDGRYGPELDGAIRRWVCSECGDVMGGGELVAKYYGIVSELKIVPDAGQDPDAGKSRALGPEAE